MRTVRYEPIGVIHSPLKNVSSAPLQSASARHIEGAVKLFPEYVAGLKDLEEFSHLFLIYHFHLSRKVPLRVKPFPDNKEHGVFATRAPARPNPIGLSIVRLKGVKHGTIYVEGLDVVDGTPLLDIKPYLPQFDVRRTQKIGWYKGKLRRLQSAEADRRFAR